MKEFKTPSAAVKYLANRGISLEQNGKSYIKQDEIGIRTQKTLFNLISYTTGKVIGHAYSKFVYDGKILKSSSITIE